MSKLNRDTLNEFICEIVDHFEVFLNAKGIKLDNPEKQEAIDAGEDPKSVENIYGTDFAWLYFHVAESVNYWWSVAMANMHDEFDILDTSLEEMDLSVRAFNCLKRTNLNTVSDITEYLISNDITKIRNIGPKSYEEIIRKVAPYYEMTVTEYLNFIASEREQNTNAVKDIRAYLKKGELNEH